MATNAELNIGERQSWTPQTAMDALTDNSGGTASTTGEIVAIDETITSIDIAASTGTDVPTSAAINTEFGKVNDNMATLLARISSLEDILRATGQLLT